MSAAKKYVLRDATGYFFQSTSGDGLDAYFTADVDAAYQFTKDAMAAFRRDYDYIRGRVLLVSTAARLAGKAEGSE